MKRLSLIMPVVAGTLIYSLISMVAGPKGILPQQELLAQYAVITDNTEKLTMKHMELEQLLNNLTADHDTITVYAHELGLVSEGERLIRLAGFNGGITRINDPGIVISVRKPSFIPEWICKLAGITAGLLSICLLFWEKHKQKRKSTLQQ